MKNKLGLFDENENDEILITDLLMWMHKNKADYTNTFCYLMKENIRENKIYKNDTFIDWQKKWLKRLGFKNNSFENSLNIMRKVNPLVIPRNHKVEEALDAANKNDLNLLNNLLKILKTPYESQKNIEDYQDPAPLSKKKYQTFCGT